MGKVNDLEIESARTLPDASLSPMQFVLEDDEGLQVKLLIQPNAKKSEIVGIHEGRLKVRISSPPVDDAANKECISFLCRFLNVSKSSVRLLKGDKSRLKLFRLRGLPQNEFLEKLGL